MTEPTQRPDADPSQATGAEVPTFLSGAVSPTTPPNSANAAPANSRTTIDVGAKLGPYLLEAKLGEGGMGAVYKARHEHLEKIVALKVLSAQVMQNADAVARFRREMKAVGRLTHPNIVQAHDAGEVDGTHFLAMEYVEGSDLQQFIKHKGPVTAVVACKIIRQAALALSAAHTVGLIHRDIKPSNLLVSKSGQIKLLDLGLALLSTDTQESTELTTAGQTFGTPDYMAPEQWENSHAVDGRVDLYALGCTLFFLLAGRTPYSGDKYRTAVSKMKGHVTSPIPDLKAAVPTVPDGVAAIYVKLLAKEPADRYQTAAELAEALAPFSSSKTAIPGGAASSSTAIGPVSGAVNLTPPTGLQGVTQKLPAGADESTFLATRLASLIGPKGNRRKLLLGGSGLVVMLLLAVIGYSLSGSKTPPPNSKPAEASLAARTVESPTAPVAFTPAATGWQGWPADAPKPAIAPFNAAQAKQHQEEWATYLKMPVEYTNTLGMKFRLIPPGEFLMGSTAEEIAAAMKGVVDDEHWQKCLQSEAPRHKVILTQPFYLGVHEVTQGAYEKITGKTPSQFAPTGEGKAAVRGQDTTHHPVEMLCWNDAAEFCAKLSLQEKLPPFYQREKETVRRLNGSGYRLPTEAEWEFACRAGTTTSYWTGDTPDDLSRAGWFQLNSGGRTHEVGEKEANPFGMHDMLGNAWEWVQDGWDSTDYARFSAQPAMNPTGSTLDIAQRVVRGGMWGWNAEFCRASSRSAGNPEPSLRYAGARVALPVDVVKAAIARTTTNAPTSWHGWPADAPKPAIAPFGAKQAKQCQEEWAAYLKVPAEYTNSIGMKFRLIPPGEFLMGSTEEQVELALKQASQFGGAVRGNRAALLKSETPQHRVVISRPFQIGATEVTVAQFRKFVEMTKYVTDAERFGFSDSNSETLDASVKESSRGQSWRIEGRDHSEEKPVSHLSWNDAEAYCRWLSTHEQAVYRLPTEAEWEYACRGGTTTQFCFGDDVNMLNQYGVSKKLAGGAHAEPVGIKLPNPFGLFDMHGNVSEWCLDFYEAGWYEKSPTSDPTGPDSGMGHVYRGGRFTNYATYCRSADRGDLRTNAAANTVWLRGPTTGFRCVRVADAPVPTASVSQQPTVPAASSGKLFMHDPAFVQWIKDVQAMPAEQQIEAVSKKLMELNPGFDGKETHLIVNEQVTELQFGKQELTDLSPVRALRNLRRLTFQGGKLADLSPLQGLKLVDLNLEFTKVANLSPLQGMKLEGLCCWHTPVADLSPLKGMPLKNLLLDSTQITDLTPLQGMPLIDLRIAGTSVSDLSPLEGMPLTSLICHGTKVSNLSPLRGMKLTKLYCESTPVADLSPLKGMPLQSFASHTTKVTDLSALKDMPLKEIWCDVKPERDSETLRSLKTLEKINSKPAAEFWKEVAAQ